MKKKKGFGIVLGVLVIIILLVFIVVQWAPSVFDSVEVVSVEGSNCWMANISDDTVLSDIAIPGAHDYGSRNVQLALFSKCQDRSTKELLEDGFRYLDIRLGVESVCGEPVLSLYHGFTHCMTGNTVFSGNLFLDQLIEDCQSFLQENPTETILFVVKKEHGDETVDEFEKLLHATNSDSFLLTDTIPTLGEARGKIVLFRRYEDEAALGKESGIYINWSQQKNNTDVMLSYETCEEDTFTAHVQDRYKYGTEEKWNAFMTTLDATEALLQTGVVLNFLSTNGTSTYGHPYKYAKKLNKRFLDSDFSGKKMGWVILDFGNAELAQKVYESNF